jgi:hypothetical protein
VEEAAAQEGVGQFLFVVGGDEHQRAVLGLDELARLVAVELHAVELAQQVVGELDVGLVDLVDQQRHRAVGREGLPQHALDDVVADVLDALARPSWLSRRRLTASYSYRPCCALVVDLMCHCSSGMSSAWATSSASMVLPVPGSPLTSKALQSDGGVDGQHQVLGGDVILGALEFHENKCGIVDKWA